jgi:hypothetical protein
VHDSSPVRLEYPLPGLNKSEKQGPVNGRNPALMSTDAKKPEKVPEQVPGRNSPPNKLWPL